MNNDQEQIIVFDDEQLSQEDDKENIFVFDQDEVEQETMSKKDFEECCSRLSDRIIFSNLKNFTEGVVKPTPTFFQQARKQRRQSEKQRESLRNIPNTKDRPSLASQLPKDVRVEYLPEQNFSRRSLEESLRGELRKGGMQGASLSTCSKPELKVEQQKDRSMLKVSNFRQFLYSQLQPGYHVSLRLRKVESGLLSTTYKCYFAQNEQFVLSVQKSSLGGYVFSSSQVHISEQHISCLAKMQSDFLGKQFRLYDAGEDFSKTKIMQHYKKQMAYIAYSQEKDQPRKIATVISTSDNALTDFTVIDRKAENILLEKWNRGQQENLLRMCSRQPSYDSKDQIYKLNFLGLAGVASTKNFILEDEDHPEALIFGRQDKDNYLMQIKSPFSILQAVAVALSSIHYKFL